MSEEQKAPTLTPAPAGNVPTSAPTATFECKKCSTDTFKKTFPSRMALVAHLRVHSSKKKRDDIIDTPHPAAASGGVGSYMCRGCNRPFEYHGAYITHLTKCFKYQAWKKKQEQLVSLAASLSATSVPTLPSEYVDGKIPPGPPLIDLGLSPTTAPRRLAPATPKKKTIDVAIVTAAAHKKVVAPKTTRPKSVAATVPVLADKKPKMTPKKVTTLSTKKAVEENIQQQQQPLVHSQPQPQPVRNGVRQDEKKAVLQVVNPVASSPPPRVADVVAAAAAPLQQQTPLSQVKNTFLSSAASIENKKHFARCMSDLLVAPPVQEDFSIALCRTDNTMSSRIDAYFQCKQQRQQSFD